MKPTQLTELFANIKNSFVSFFSILMFVALGMGMFLGITWVAPALHNAADKAFAEGRFHNFQIQFPYGLTDDDLDKLAQVEGVSQAQAAGQVEAGRQSFQTLRVEGKGYTVKVQSLGQVLDSPLAVEGELPSKADEMAFHRESANTLGIAVGDSVTFEHDVSADSAENLPAGIGGDSTLPAADTSDGMQYLNGSTFKVTAIVDSADYVAKSGETYGYSNSPSGAVNALAWLPDAAFDAAAFQNGYPVVNVSCESLAGLSTFSDEYEKKSSEVQERITALGKELALARYDQLHDNALTQVDQAEKQLEDARAQIAAGEKQVEDGEVQLEQARREADAAIASGRARLASAYDELLAGEAVKAQGEAELSAARAKLDEAQAGLSEVDALKAEASATAKGLADYKAEQDKALASGEITQKAHDKNLDKYGAQTTAQLQPIAQRFNVELPTIDHTNYDTAITVLETAVQNAESITIEVDGETMTVGEARAKTAEYEAEYAASQAEYEAKVAELSAGWAQYYAGQQELQAKTADGEQQIADGEAELESAKQRLADAKAQVAENEPKLEKAKEEVDSLRKYDWTVLPRAYNAGMVEVSTFSGVTERLSISMAGLFIIVGLLVSYFAVSRLVHEQVSQIGTKKALGFRRGEITRSFLLYSGIAVIAGAVLGGLLAYFLVEGIVGGALSEKFIFGAYPAYFGWQLFLVMTAIELVLILGTTYLACRSVLKRHAVELLRGEKPPVGKTRFYERWGIWEKLPLLVQTIVNNCVNDKRRMLSTIVGVAGSTALIVTAITLNNDVMKSYDRQYEDVYGFNAIAYVDSKVKGSIDNVDAAFKAEGATTSRVFMKRYMVEQPNGESGAMRIIVPADQGTFDQLYHVNPLTGTSFDLSGEGAWVSQAYGEHMGVKAGDIVTIDAGDGTKHQVPVLGFYEFNLTYHEMVVGERYFHEEFGEAPANALFVNMGAASVDELRNAASAVEGFDSIVDDAAYQHKNFEDFSSVSGAVVAIYLALAALMSVVVLLNLNVMFIEEKKRELIVLMINGFSVKDAKHYISYDSIVLTALGIVVGIVLGCIMGSITVVSIEPSTGSFVSSPDAWAIIIGIVGSAVLALIMGWIALRRIPCFALTDINRM